MELLLEAEKILADLLALNQEYPHGADLRSWLDGYNQGRIDAYDVALDLIRNLRGGQAGTV